MTQYYWYSHKQARKDAGTVQVDRNGETYTDLGYAICMNIRTQEFFQFNHISIKNRPEKDMQKNDIEKVLIIDYPHEIDIALDRKGNLSKMAKNYCRDHGFAMNKASLQYLTNGFKEVAKKKDKADKDVKVKKYQRYGME